MANELYRIMRRRCLPRSSLSCRRPEEFWEMNGYSISSRNNCWAQLMNYKETRILKYYNSGGSTSDLSMSIERRREWIIFVWWTWPHLYVSCFRLCQWWACVQWSVCVCLLNRCSLSEIGSLPYPSVNPIINQSLRTHFHSQPFTDKNHGDGHPTAPQ